MSWRSYVYQDGTKYDGEWQDGKRHGHGVLTNPDGTVYAGEWVNNKLHGQGTITFPNGKRYIGEWANDPGSTAFFVNRAWLTKRAASGMGCEAEMLQPEYPNPGYNGLM